MSKDNSSMLAIIGGTSGIGLDLATFFFFKKENIKIYGRRKVENLPCEYLDVLDEENIKGVFKDTNELKKIIYCAGITCKKQDITSFSKENWLNIINTNVTGLLLVLKHTYKYLVKNQGKIVVVNSIASRNYSLFSGVEYTMSKCALSGLVRQLSQDFALDNVLINSVFPSMTLTPMLVDNVEKQKLENIIKHIPLGRLATTQDIIYAIDFLLSDKNSYMTGIGIDVNGGQFLNG
ncbi:SDR family oxidoreductase [Campylobacter lari]|nr:SDR family oxidoreductase [Campylobacter lari]